MKLGFSALAATFSLVGFFAIGETVSFEADGNVVFVRTYDQFGTAIVEFIGEPGAIYQCVAMDNANAPIATATALADMGQILIPNLDASAITTIKCRKTN